MRHNFINNKTGCSRKSSLWCWYKQWAPMLPIWFVSKNLKMKIPLKVKNPLNMMPHREIPMLPIKITRCMHINIQRCIPPRLTSSMPINIQLGIPTSLTRSMPASFSRITPAIMATTIPPPIVLLVIISLMLLDLLVWNCTKLLLAMTSMLWNNRWC